MAFYIMKQDVEIEGSAALDGLPKGMDSVDWISGKKMPPPPENLVLDLSLESGDYRGDIIDSFITLYSDEIKEALSECGVDNIDYYPVRLRDQEDDSTEGGFWIANIIGLLDCIDMDKSKTKPWVTGIGVDFESIVIDEAKTNDAKIFRLKEDPTKVVINQELKDYFDETDLLVGVELIQTEDYSDW